MSVIQNTRTAFSSIHFRSLQSLPPSIRPFVLPTTLALSTYTLYWLVQDYNEFMSLGPGGPPYNVFGWFMVNILCRPFATSDKGSLSTSLYPSTGAHPSIVSLPERSGSRAEVKGIAPQRQLNQHPPESMRASLRALFDGAVTRYSNLIYEAQSKYERRNSAIFAHTSTDGSTPKVARLSQGEIGHIHGDMSVHLYLSPADARVAVEKGWCQRHRFANGGNMFGIAHTYLLFYGPRDEKDLDVMRVFLERSIEFMTGTTEKVDLS